MMAAPRRIQAVVLGYIGFENTGDELLLTALRRGIERHGIPIGLTVLSRNSAKTREVHGVASPDYPPFAGGLPITWTARWRRCRAIARADLLIVGPGGFLQDYDTRGVRSMFGTFRGVLLARLFGARVVSVGLGAGPLVKPWGRRFARWICALSDVLVVRDETSAALLGAIGVDGEKIAVAADLAFTCSAPEHVPHTSKTLGVSIFEFYNYIHGQRDKTDECRRVLASCLDHVAERGHRIAFIAMQGALGGHDEAEARAIAALMRHGGDVTIHPYDDDPERTFATVARCDWFLGMRFHGIVMALLSGIPAAAISYHPKVDSLMDTLGLSSQRIALGELDERNLSALIDRLLEQRQLDPAVRSKCEEQSRLAEKNFEIIARYCQTRWPGSMSAAGDSR